MDDNVIYNVAKKIQGKKLIELIKVVINGPDYSYPADYRMHYVVFDEFIKKQPINLDVAVGYSHTTPLILAIENNLYPIIDCLIENGANTHLGYGVASPIKSAIKMKNQPLVKKLVEEKGVPLTIEILNGALNLGNPDMIELLIKLGAPSVSSNAGDSHEVRSILEAAQKAEDCVKESTLDQFLEISANELASANLIARAKNGTLPFSQEFLAALGQEGSSSTNELVTSLYTIVKPQLTNRLKDKTKEIDQLKEVVSTFGAVNLEPSDDSLVQQTECTGDSIDGSAL